MTAIETDVVIVGAGGCGLTAALAAAQSGARVLVLEKEGEPGGNTGQSAGLVMAANSRLQRAAGLEGTAEELAEDIWRANGRTSDRALTLALCRASGPTLDWMSDLGVPFELMPDYRYPGHSRAWLHATPERHGAPIVAALAAALHAKPQAELWLGSPALGLTTEEGRVTGAWAQSRFGEVAVRAKATVLAADGFGANREMVQQYIPDMAAALYYGAPGNTGEAIRWGMALGAAARFMDSYQPHSSVAFPERVFVTSYILNNGGIHVNAQGRRFSDESKGYAEHALAIQRQPGAAVWEVFDDRIRRRAEAGYARFFECVQAGVIHAGDTVHALAQELGLEPWVLEETICAYNRAVEAGHDEFGRTHFGGPLELPLYAIRVTSALFHTQGGLAIDASCRVLRSDGRPIPNLYAGGGTAAGFAGEGCRGYLGGVGLLSAFGLGKIAGEMAAHG